MAGTRFRESLKGNKDSLEVGRLKIYRATRDRLLCEAVKGALNEGVIGQDQSIQNS